MLGWVTEEQIAEDATSKEDEPTEESEI